MFEPTTLLILGAAVLGYFWWTGDSPTKTKIKEKIVKDGRFQKENLMEVRRLLDNLDATEVSDIIGNLALDENEAANTSAETLNKNLKSDEFKGIMFRRIAKRVLAFLLERNEHKQFVYDIVDKARKSE